MSVGVFFAVLAAAAMHALWNAFIKVKLDRFMAITLMSVGMGGIALAALPFAEVPRGITWVWIVTSVALHMGYRLFLTKAYESGDLAQSYPLARGTAPLLTTLGGILLLREVPGVLTATGIVLLSAGTWLMSRRGGHPSAAIGGRAVLYALITSVFIAGYTLTDGTGARGAASVTSYAAWLFVADGAACMALCVIMRGPGVFRIIVPEWKTIVIAGALAAAAYWTAMWAMTQAPIAAVAALRETSILFAMLISMFALKEKMTGWRAAAALFIVAGVVALRLN